MTSAPSPHRKLSLLDRLLNDRGTGAGKRGPGFEVTEAAIREAVRRDLEDLLNTRCLPPPQEFQQLQDSLVAYGVPDWSVDSGGSIGEQICLRLRLAIQRFEPRLCEIQVTSAGVSETAENALSFRISAVLRTEALTAAILFDSVLNPANGSFDVTRGTP